MLQSSKCVNDKCLQINTGALKEKIFKKEIKTITWIKNAQQITDSLTKHGVNLLSLIKMLQRAKFIYCSGLKLDFFNCYVNFGPFLMGSLTYLISITAFGTIST